MVSAYYPEFYLLTRLLRIKSVCWVSSKIYIKVRHFVVWAFQKNFVIVKYDHIASRYNAKLCCIKQTKQQQLRPVVSEKKITTTSVSAAVAVAVGIFIKIHKMLNNVSSGYYYYFFLWKHIIMQIVVDKCGQTPEVLSAKQTNRQRFQFSC